MNIKASIMMIISMIIRMMVASPSGAYSPSASSRPMAFDADSKASYIVSKSERLRTSTVMVTVCVSVPPLPSDETVKVRVSDSSDVLRGTERMTGMSLGLVLLPRLRLRYLSMYWSSQLFSEVTVMV